MTKAIIFAKECSCHIKDFAKIKQKLIQRGYSVVFRRTSLDPADHILASKLWGSEYYPPFVTLGGIPTALTDIDKPTEAQLEAEKVKTSVSTKKTAQKRSRAVREEGKK